MRTSATWSTSDPYGIDVNGESCRCAHEASAAKKASMSLAICGGAKAGATISGLDALDKISLNAERPAHIVARDRSRRRRGGRVKLRRYVALAIVCAAALAAAGGASSGGAKQALTPVTYATSFGTFGRDAYAYVALEKGFFRNAGFDVKIVPGAGSVAVAQSVAAGSVDFGPADVAAVAVARAESGVPVKVVALIQQTTMAAFFALKSSGISKPADLA